jgi:hypothetical protein
MTTQTLRGMANDGPMHWRGDRTGGNDVGGNALAEDQAFKKFNVAFSGLLGRSGPLTTAEMQAFTDFILQVTLPPNPIRALDNSLTPDEQGDAISTERRRTSRDVQRLSPARSVGRRVRDRRLGFGTRLWTSRSHPWNPTRIGMFGMPAIAFINPGDKATWGRRFVASASSTTAASTRSSDSTGHRVSFSSDAQRRQVERFMFAFDSNLAPIAGQQVTLTSTNGATAARASSLTPAALATAISS